jgi:hypothetical protein
MAGPTVRKAAEYFFAEIAQLPDGTYYISLTATSVDDEEPQLLNQEIDSRRGVTLEEVLAMIKSDLTGSTRSPGAITPSSPAKCGLVFYCAQDLLHQRRGTDTLKVT